MSIPPSSNYLTRKRKGGGQHRPTKKRSRRNDDYPTFVRKGPSWKMRRNSIHLGGKMWRKESNLNGKKLVNVRTGKEYARMIVPPKTLPCFHSKAFHNLKKRKGIGLWKILCGPIGAQHLRHTEFCFGIFGLPLPSGRSHRMTPRPPTFRFPTKKNCWNDLWASLMKRNWCKGGRM